MADIRVPTLGESVTEATVATWFKKVGDAVKVDEMLCELETDKVTVEVPATAAGVLAEIVAKEGETVGVDALLATIDEKAAGEAREAGRRRPPTKAAEAPAAKPGKAAAGRRRNRRPPTSRSIEIMVPTLGESVTEATVSTWFKKVGDAVTQDEMLCELETDKVSVEVPAPASGTLAEIYAEDGATVQAGGKLGRIGGTAPPARGRRPRPREAPPAAAAAEPRPPPAAKRDVEDAPSANKLMADRGIAPEQVEGTGRDGRIMKEDVLRAEAPTRPAPAPAPAPEPAPIPRAPVPAEDAAREERVKMTRLRQTIARRLKEAQNTAAMLTTYNEVDMTGGHGAAQRVQGAVREEARGEARLHVVLHQGLLPRAAGGARGQRRDRRHRHRLQALRPHGHRRRHADRPRGAGGARRRPAVVRGRSRRRSTSSAPAPATASCRWPRCRAAPSPSRTAASTAR